MLAHIIEDATLFKHPVEGTTTIYVRFSGGKTETLTVQNPKSSAQPVASLGRLKPGQVGLRPTQPYQADVRFQPLQLAVRDARHQEVPQKPVNPPCGIFSAGCGQPAG